MKTNRRSMLLMIYAFAGMVVGIYRAFLMDFTHPGKVYYGLLVVLGAACAAAAFLLGARPLPAQRIENQTFKMAVATSAILLFLSAGVRLFSMISSRQGGLLTAATLALALVSAFGILYSVVSDDKEMTSVFSVIPVFFMCLMLLVVYKDYVSASPVIGYYATEVLAVMLLTLAVYGVSSMRFVKQARNFLISFSLLGAVVMTSVVVVSAVLTLTDYRYPLGFAETMMLVAVAVYCGTCFVFPPRMPKEDARAQKKAEPELPSTFFDHEKDEPLEPDLDSIIEEVKADRAAEEGLAEEQDIWDFIEDQTKKDEK